MRFSKTATLLSLMVAIQASAWGSIITGSPTLPLAGAVYIASGGAQCFVTTGFCVVPGSFTLTSVVNSTFNPAGQDILTNVTFSGDLTTLGNVPLGVVTLTGTMEQEIQGRTFSTESGTWTTEILSLALSGPALGHTLSVGLDSTQTSTGVSSLIPDGANFRFDSSVNMFVEWAYDGITPIRQAGQLNVALAPNSPAAVPEPSSLSLMAISLALLGLGRRKQP